MSRTTDKEILLSIIPASGENIGNVALVRELEQRGWAEDKYWRIRDALIADGLLVRGRGRGGSIRRASVTEQSDTTTPLVVKSPRTTSPNEADLYDPILHVLRSEWVREMRMEPDQVHFEVTARQGKKQTGGTWTRPDITGVSVRTFQHLPNKYLDIWTFEIKAIDWLNVTAIFEAAAHGSRATRSYALLQIPEQTNARVDGILERCEREANRLRVGLITFTEPSDFATWDIRVEAPRVEADPEALEDFISQLSDEAKKRLSRWK